MQSERGRRSERSKALDNDEVKKILADIRTVEISRPHFRPRGVLLGEEQEFTIHEYAHMATLGVDFGYSRQLHTEIGFYIQGRPGGALNEIRTLAAEIVVIRRFSFLQSAGDFLDWVQGLSRLNNLRARVERRLYGRRWRIAEDDADRTLALIRIHARQARET